MNYTETLNAIKNASLFDLYRLSVAIHNEMESPARIKEVKRAFKEGDIIFYFSAINNKLIQAKVIQKNLKYVLVENIEDHKRWQVEYCSLNLAQVDTSINMKPQERLSKNTLKVGDIVGFNSDGVIVTGAIVRMNSKTVTLVTRDNKQWRVSYDLLFRVIDAGIN
jgi:hypothetical protein